MLMEEEREKNGAGLYRKRNANLQKRTWTEGGWTRKRREEGLGGQN